MSNFTPEAIKIKLTAYDAIVRNAVKGGKLSTVIDLENEVVSCIFCSFHFLKFNYFTQKTFYKTCMRFTDSERQAAFNMPLFVHGFLKEFRKKKDDPKFMEDQRVRLNKYDAKHLAEVVSKDGQDHTAATKTSQPIMAEHQENSTPAGNVTADGSSSAVMKNITATQAIAATDSTAAGKTTAATNTTAATHPTAVIKPTAVINPPAVVKSTADKVIAASRLPVVQPSNNGGSRKFPPLPKPKSLLPPSSGTAVFGGGTHTVNPSKLPLTNSIKSKPPLPNSIKSKPLPFQMSRPSKSSAPATPGPGPRSMEIAAAGKIRYPRLTSSDLNNLQSMDEEDVRKFRDIEEEGSSDSDDIVPRPTSKRVEVDGKGKMKAKESSKKRRRDSSSMNVILRKRVKSALAIIRGRGRVENLDDEESEGEDRNFSMKNGDDSEKEDEYLSVIRSRPVKSMPRQDRKPTVHRSPSGQYHPIPTGEYHDSKCSKC